MMNRMFWEEAKKAWVTAAPPKITQVNTGSGGPIDASLLKDPWDLGEEEEIPFDQMNYEDAVRAVMTGQMFPNTPDAHKTASQAARSADVKPVKKPPRPKLNVGAFEKAMEKQTISGFISAGKMLCRCELPEEMNALYEELIQRMTVLGDAITKFDSVYQPVMDQFYEYYIPEALQLTATYLEYLDAGIGEDIVKSAKNEVLDAVKKLILAVNEKTDEIYKYATIEIKAKAKALEALMSQSGFVDPEYKF